LADIEALERNPPEHYRPDHSVFELLMRIAALHADKLAIRCLAMPSRRPQSRGQQSRKPKLISVFRRRGASRLKPFQTTPPPASFKTRSATSWLRNRRE